MDIHEFIAVADDVVDRLTPLVSGEYAALIRSACHAGAWEVGIPELAGALIEESIAVSLDDRDKIRSLLSALKESPEDADLLIVTPTSHE